MDREEDNWEDINPDGRVESVTIPMLDGEWVHVLSPQQYFEVQKINKILGILIVIGFLVVSVLL